MASGRNTGWGFTGRRVCVFSPRKMARTMSPLKIMGRSVMVRLHGLSCCFAPAFPAIIVMRTCIAEKPSPHFPERMVFYFWFLPAIFSQPVRFFLGHAGVAGQRRRDFTAPCECCGLVCLLLHFFFNGNSGMFYAARFKKRAALFRGVFSRAISGIIRASQTWGFGKVYRNSCFKLCGIFPGLIASIIFAPFSVGQHFPSARCVWSRLIWNYPNKPCPLNMPLTRTSGVSAVPAVSWVRLGFHCHHAMAACSTRQSR